MNKFQVEPEVSCYSSEDDLIAFDDELQIWLKPICKINTCVQLPSLKQPGQCISTLQVMEKLKKRIEPYQFKSIKIIKSTLDFIKYEGNLFTPSIAIKLTKHLFLSSCFYFVLLAELESKSSMNSILARLDKTTLKLDGFEDILKVTACKFKVSCTQHEWESFFRDNPLANEKEPGLRPDTIYVQNLPVKWFGGERPKPNLLLKAFSRFGDIRRYHIPCLDETNEMELNDVVSFNQTSSGFKRFNFHESLTFDAFIMYRDYIGFVKAIETLRNTKLVKKLEENTCNYLCHYLEYDIKVDFDKSSHLSDKSIQSRQMEKRLKIKSLNQDQKDDKSSESEGCNEKEEQKVKKCKLDKKRAKKLLLFLFQEIEKEMKKNKLKEERKEERKKEKNKKRLLHEESKLRQKLIQRRNDQIRHIVSKHDQSFKQVHRSSNLLKNINLFCKNENVTYKHTSSRSLVIAIDNK